MNDCTRSMEELETRFDKWLFVLRNLNRLDRVPDKLKEQIFEKLSETAEIAKFTPDQVRSYEDSLKYYRDLKNSLDAASDDRALDIATKLLKNGISMEVIAQSTGLTIEQIEKLK